MHFSMINAGVSVLPLCFWYHLKIDFSMNSANDVFKPADFRYGNVF